MRSRRKHIREEAELDITSFMNLMIILVPVLLLSMVFARTTVVDLKLPNLASESSGQESDENLILEVVLRDDYMDVNYPAGTLLKRLPNISEDEAGEGQGESESIDITMLGDIAATEGGIKSLHDFETLSLVLQEVKRQLSEQGIEKRDILLLSEPNTSYQTLISAMDSIRSYKALVVADVVDAVLFPDISLGDAPLIDTKVAMTGGGQ